MGVAGVARRRSNGVLTSAIVLLGGFLGGCVAPDGSSAESARSSFSKAIAATMRAHSYRVRIEAERLAERDRLLLTVERVEPDRIRIIDEDHKEEDILIGATVYFADPHREGYYFKVEESSAEVFDPVLRTLARLERVDRVWRDGKVLAFEVREGVVSRHSARGRIVLTSDGRVLRMTIDTEELSQRFDFEYGETLEEVTPPPNDRVEEVTPPPRRR